ncbi:DNA modification methylase ['Chrysanthemum coronarium' phytoplasma]|uniref:DNA modification methylase n=2 Tax='Chrysanthemum coronarium' phytoplasma TaxID=1520703 RepID=A0ABQ0J1Q2_9MOLU|nr:DNA modification methylase ['Chrysanthemum coronarium' phytoplasma]
MEKVDKFMFFWANKVIYVTSGFIVGSVLGTSLYFRSLLNEPKYILKKGSSTTINNISNKVIGKDVLMPPSLSDNLMHLWFDFINKQTKTLIQIL